MWKIKEDSIKPINYLTVEEEGKPTQYIVFVEYIVTDTLGNRVVEKTRSVMRFCRAKKNGDIAISFNGKKIQSNLSQLKSGFLAN